MCVPGGVQGSPGAGGESSRGEGEWTHFHSEWLGPHCCLYQPRYIGLSPTPTPCPSLSLSLSVLSGPTHVGSQLRSLLNLWRSSFPRSMKELGEEQTGGTLNFWTTALETRTGALSCEWL